MVTISGFLIIVYFYTMFRRDVQSIKDLVMRNLRVQGLETPLLQKRLVEAWPVVAGAAVARYTESVTIINQTLFVKIAMPALRADLSMRKVELVKLLNNYVEAQIIADIRFIIIVIRFYYSAKIQRIFQTTKFLHNSQQANERTVEQFLKVFVYRG